MGEQRRVVVVIVMVIGVVEDGGGRKREWKGNMKGRAASVQASRFVFVSFRLASFWFILRRPISFSFALSFHFSAFRFLFVSISQ